MLYVHQLNKSIWQSLLTKSFEYYSELYPSINNELPSRFNASSKQPLEFKKYPTFTFFVEPSTRTKSSFMLALQNLGIQPIDMTSENSALSKGESIRDTFLHLEAMGFRLGIVRLKEEILSEIKKELTTLKIISAGEGCISHPSQALLDACTILQHCQNSSLSFEQKNILFIGDIEHSRVYQSNVEWMSWYGYNVQTISPLKNETLTPVFLEQADVIILLRPQLERHQTQNNFSIQNYLANWGITSARLKMLQPHTIIMHPGPFYPNVEFEENLLRLDKNTQQTFKIYQQVKWGVPSRMALIQHLLSEMI